MFRDRLCTFLLILGILLIFWGSIALNWPNP